MATPMTLEVASVAVLVAAVVLAVAGKPDPTLESDATRRLT